MAAMDSRGSNAPTTILLLMICLMSTCIIYIQCSPPSSRIECQDGLLKCNVTNAYDSFPDRSQCLASEAAYPRTESELVEVIARAARTKTKMRVATTYCHSIPKLICPAGDNGVVISTDELDRVVDVDASAMRMTVQSGATLRCILDTAAEHGLALTYSPYWDGLTLGGMLGTGAHGSSLFGKGGAVHEYVVSLRMVVPATEEDGFAKVVELHLGDEDLDAAKVSLGVLGVISQVTLQLEPMFKRSVTNIEMQDVGLEENIWLFGLQHEFADVNWYPAQSKVVYRLDDRVPVLIPGNGVNNFIGFRSTWTAILCALRDAEEILEATKHPKCLISTAQTTLLQALGEGLSNNNGGIFLGYPVVGFQNKMQSSGACLSSGDDHLLTACAWDPRIKGLFFFQIGASIALPKMAAFILDMKKLRDMRPESLCGLDVYDGILMRYVKASSAYLGKQEDSVDLDLSYYKPHKPDVPVLYIDVFQELEQIALFKYGGIPHWGKNRNIAFKGIPSKFKKFKEFMSTKERYDPDGLFSNEWTDAIFKDDVEILRDGCAIEGLCVCSKDEHCAPQIGYFCKPGLVYEDARVCRFES